MVRTLGLHVIHPVVKLADGTYLAGSRSIDTEGEFLQTEVAFGGMRWHKLDPQKVVTAALAQPQVVAASQRINTGGLITSREAPSPSLSLASSQRRSWPSTWLPNMSLPAAT